MGDASKIEWCDSTFNPWEGCTKVGPGCDHCYAENRNARFSGGEAPNWGPGATRRRTSPSNWRKPALWNARPFWHCPACGWRGETDLEARDSLESPPYLVCMNCISGALQPTRRRVFCASLADVFDNEVPASWRADLFSQIRATPNLDWLLLTKRIGNAERMIDEAGGWAGATVDSRRNPMPNIWLGATICNQAEADRDIPKLLQVPARVRFLSMEPLLGPVDLKLDRLAEWNALAAKHGQPHASSALHWIIAGGESGPKARPSHPDWFRSLRDQCAAAGVPFLFKQWGEWRPPLEGEQFDTASGLAGKPPAFLVDPDDGTVHCFYRRDDESVRPSESPYKALIRVGKKSAGRLLDGREHSEFPERAA